ncbi:vacuolar protein-sorting protein bro1 [Blastomyces dermatitidis ER-3]|uniref:BRO domain-containing protein 1 n=1 Tax=Ajellomyces dermatitidis (strain ER-3 / ATCC MYA-2586) TaxID=559297 RepID=A0ABP2F318_AJEDR|nr:vacuolar protein-sorting protein bro1 [Blastomyces dermatitidis ER-3]EEQ91236.1 vacuolar protein-sorting protein bro1 [Blastomyces dermatitidis ER-3]
MVQSPMISSPLKQTSEIDWIQPLKAYIRQTYGDDPERYSEECATLNRLRQDMRGAGKDSAAGRDLLYRYYGQLELLDLRFPVDENHIKISFTWYDAFTHKPTSQYSLAYEKASIIFNISAVLSCHAANQDRSEDTGLKTAYHSFQASAGMFTYINENFLHAPSTDLSRDTVKTLISIMLAQGQEVFLEKQIADEKKPGFLAKLASQAAYLYSQAAEGVQENVAKGIFEKVWSIVIQIKASLLAAVAGYYQAIADDEGALYGISIARLQLAEKQATSAMSWAKSFPSSPPAGSNLSADTGPILLDLTRRQLANIQEKLALFNKDNDFIYHQPIPSEPSLSTIAKLPAAKAMSVSELYQGQDIQRIIGPDIFQKIVPMSVTESASLYDEEKAKLVRAEAEKVEAANGEMAASLDYLKLPGSLNILKGGMDQDMDVDEDFKMWCDELADAPPFREAFNEVQEEKISILSVLDQCSKQLDMEESVCEKMRSKYGADWVQQPSSRLTSTLRSDIRSYRDTIGEASSSDSQLLVNLRQHETDFEEMRSAGETDEADVLFQRALIKVGGKGKGRNGHGSPYTAAPETNLLGDDFEAGASVAEQIARVEELLRKLNLVKRDRNQILKDLKEKVHNDDISNVLILNKKSIANQENQLFQTELEKFRPHQNRLLQANHKQTALMKELTKVYGDLLQDNRVRSEQSKYEVLTRQRNSVMSKYKKIYNAFKDINSGLQQAQAFYAEMKDTVDSLRKNVDTFVNNRRSEGAQLLSQIERDKAHHQSSQEDREREKLKSLMERLSVETSPQSQPTSSSSKPRPSPLKTTPGRSPSISTHHNTMSYPSTSQYMTGQQQQQPQPQPQPQPPLQQQQQQQPQQYPQQGPPGVAPSAEGYNPMAYLYQPPISPPPNQQYFSPSQYGYASPQQPTQFMPQGYIPPPPPPRPSQSPYPQSSAPYPPAGYMQPRPYSAMQQQHPSQTPQGPSGGQSNSNDPWAGLNAWK